MSKELIIVTRTSPFSGKQNTRDIELDMADYESWASGKQLIQNALPYLSPDDREFLMTGITPEEFNGLFEET